MSCRSYREELSRCLDGRLPGHARGRVMGHIAQCSGCAHFWEELKAAQELVLGLPQAQVGPGFRDDVWQRIQSGEGAPDTIAQEPVPVLTKMRYGLLGAAAAAVFILAVHYGVGNSSIIQESPEPGAVASGTTDVTKSPVTVTKSPVTPQVTPFVTPHVATATVADLTPANLAAKTAEQVSLAARSLRNRSKNLTNISDFRPEVIRDVRREIKMVQHGLVMLKLLRKDYGIEFRDREASDCETRVLTTLAINSELEQPEQIMRTLHALTGCSLDRLHERLLFSLRSNIPNERFLRIVWENQHQILRFVRIVPIPSGRPGEMRVCFRMIQVVPQPAGPEKQPAKTEPAKLRERSRR